MGSHGLPFFFDYRGLRGWRIPVESPWNRRLLGGKAPMEVEAGKRVGDDTRWPSSPPCTTTVERPRLDVSTSPSPLICPFLNRAGAAVFLRESHRNATIWYAAPSTGCQAWAINLGAIPNSPSANWFPPPWEPSPSTLPGSSAVERAAVNR